MMGTTKLSEIKRKLRLAARESGPDLKAWVNQQRGKQKGHGPSRVLEELDWLRELLREAVAEKKTPSRKAKKTAKKPAKAR
jgi:hypothetical protein